MSDHLPCLLKLNDPSIFIKPPTKITTRGLNHEKISELKNKLLKINWDDKLGKGTVTEQYTTFHDTLQNIIDEVAPYHTIKIPNNKIIKNPWLSVGLHKCHKKHQKLYKETLKHTCTNEDHLRYKTYRNKLKQILRNAKEDYDRNKCTEYRNNISRLWKMINKLTNKTNDKANIIEYLKVDNQDYYEHKLIAEEFAKYFSEVGKHYAEQIPSPTNDINHYLSYIPDNPKTIFMNPVLPSKIEKLIVHLPNKNSSGHDNLSNILLKQIRSSIIHPLTIISNNAITEGEFPQGMKAADVPTLQVQRKIHGN